MNVRKYLSGALVVFLFFLLGTPNVASVKAASKAPGISAEAAALIDVASGRILYSKNGSKKMRIASLTKTMTAIVAIENGRLEDIVSVPKEAVGVEGSSIYLKNGEKLTLEELLYGLMLRSGNDAAVTVAHHIGGSVPGFVYLMNEKAAMIGMSHTNFTNPHGLDDSNMHYSTAEDMAKLSAYALKNPVFRQIVSTKVKNISWEGEEYDRRLQNKNKLLHLYQGADGVKTGYTKLAKRCLASSATRDGRQLATITLNAPDDWNDSMALMDWGFQQFSNVTVVEKGEIVETALSDRGQGIRLAALNEWIYPLRKEETAQIKKKVVLTEKQVSQALAGSHAGFLQIFIGDRQIGQVPLAVLGDSPTMAKSGHHPTFWERVWKIIAGGMWSA
ncbi:D-alanyl-D-alanine carboxypeptidase family protein [Brevibacillus sp. FSL L8-0520]|uniref:D-alanyl-D-alanine carboxypeptidase family protein n=1 Tax=Brevibacillus TaxID=55080 RepID=UPI0004F32DE0|nr:D-alanyl-D-alanine carboxypeptidase family protein [Brevibacillus borstelensis]KKX56926.1 peptidase S11 [Brevibacillus borstelensis cifa_chp40]MCC0562672.1 D-alanyl-D-alanine carboxypeptidase [Brevibacillus borstelensis]MCM3557436.1 D-alanyl-D-alanine carboxypeptidase [Brevibacillus borstelensis]MCM3589446.1 D-alanyl-D-alanine carboxypeptidase [Brevibacillus borstelensis]MED2009756.1 D-alanyl-D-alanine carboxypeptidase [Brevibacillus borstelensis]